MARQLSNGHGVRPNKNMSAGAAVLDREDIHASTAKAEGRLQAEILRLVQASQEGRLTERANAEEFKENDRKLLEGVNCILDALITPLHVAADYVDQFSRGDVPKKITTEYKGDFNMIKNSLNACIDGFGGLAEANAVLKRLALNDCSVKVQGSYQGIFAEVAKSTNTVEEHVIHTVEVLESLARADYKEELDTLQRLGKRSENDNLVPAAIQAMVSIDALVTDTALLTKAAVEGKLSTRADACKHQGDFRKVVEGVNATLDAVIGPLNVSAEYVDRISKGDIPPRITESYNGDFNEIKNNLNACIDAVNSLVADTGLLSKAAVEGKLGVRAEAGKHHGDYRKIVEGVNATLDAVIGPLNVSAEYVDRISKGDIPPRITDSYNGDFNEIKNNLNACIDNIKALVSETDVLIKASSDGKLATRADVGRHHGDYRRILEGVNEMLDAILLPIGEGNRVLAQISNGKIDELIAETYKGDHEKMKQSVNNMAGVLQGLQKELARLTEASREGQLAERGKPDQFLGAYAGIVKGVNEMLDAILLPIGEGNRVLSLIRGGNLREKVEIACKGDHAKMKDSINGVHAWLTDLIAYVTKVANGDMSATMVKASDQDQIHEWLLLLKTNINGLIADTDLLVKVGGVKASSARALMSRSTLATTARSSKASTRPLRWSSSR